MGADLKSTHENSYQLVLQGKMSAATEAEPGFPMEKDGTPNPNGGAVLDAKDEDEEGEKNHAL